ncbi:MAG TPA: hypothetical protein VIH57_07905 [Bacteroidales bacterium]
MQNSSDFLNQDFTESYNQLRYYGSNILDSFKFIFTVYISMVGGSITILSIDAGVNLMLLLKVLLSFTVIFGFFIMWYIIELRKYYVKTSRYINEIRKTHLTAIANEFKNKTNYYTDYDKPAYFSWRSSQILLILILSFFNSVTLGILSDVCKIGHLFISILITVLSLGLHVSFAWFILHKADKNSTGHRHLS